MCSQCCNPAFQDQEVAGSRALYQLQSWFSVSPATMVAQVLHFLPVMSFWSKYLMFSTHGLLPISFAPSVPTMRILSTCTTNVTVCSPNWKTPSIYMSTWFSMWWRSGPSPAVWHRECRRAPRAVHRPTRCFLLSDLSWEAQGRSPSWFTRQESRLDVKHHDTLTPRGLSISCLRDRVSQH